MPHERAEADAEVTLWPRLISKQRYLSPEFAALERAKLWSKVWLHAATLDMLAEPGSFVTVQLGGDVDVLVIRDDAGQIRAFHNVCQHRGRRLVDAPYGRTQTLRCPLHHWQYAFDGTLSRAPHHEAFGVLLDDGPRLPTLPCEIWRGQVFVHLGRPEQSLASWLAPVEQALGHYTLEDYALEDLKVFDLRCNWKTIADLFNEAYHLPAVHPYLLGSVDDSELVSTVHGPHMQQVFTIGRPSPLASATEVTESLEDLLRDNGADPAAMQGDARRSLEVLRAGLRDLGLPLSDAELTQGRSWLVFPSQTFQVYATRMQIHRHRPHPTDPERTMLDQFTFKRVIGDAPRPELRISFHVRPSEHEDSGRVTEDDLREAIGVQRGMRSPGIENLRVGTRESGVLHLHATIDRYLAREDD